MGSLVGSDRHGHGTSMMSQITGWSLGLSKFVLPVTVQINIFDADTQFLKSLAAIIKDVDDNDIKQAVLW